MNTVRLFLKRIIQLLARPFVQHKQDMLVKHTDQTINAIESHITAINNAHEAIPIMTHALEYAKWNRTALGSVSSPLFQSLPKSTVGTVSDSNKFWQTNQNMFSMNKDSAGIGLALMMTGSSGMAQAISSASQSYGTQPWTAPLLEGFHEIQDKHDLRQAVKTLLNPFGTKIIEEFESSLTATDHALSSSPPSFTDAAIQMRNVIEHLKGELFKRSQSAIRARRNAKWDRMASDLSIGGIGSPQSLALLAEKRSHDLLHDELTRIAKNLKTTNVSDFHFLSIDYINHLYVIGTLLDPTKI